MKYTIGSAIPESKNDSGSWSFWIVREHDAEQNAYFMTMPGYEGWFSEQFLDKKIDEYADDVREDKEDGS